MRLILALFTLSITFVAIFLAEFPTGASTTYIAEAEEEE